MRIRFKFLLIVFFILLTIAISYIMPVHFNDLNDYTALLSARYFSTHPLDILKVNGNLELQKNPLLWLFSYYRPVERIVWTVFYSVWHDNPLPFTIFSGIFFLAITFNLYILGKYLSGKWAGFFTAVAFATLVPGSYHIITYRMNASFALEIFFLTSAFILIFPAIKDKNGKRMIIGLIMAVMAYLSKESSMYIIPTVILGFILIYKKNVKNDIRITGAILMFCFLSLLLFYNSRFLSYYGPNFIKNPHSFISIKYIMQKSSYFKYIYINFGIILLSVIFASLFLHRFKKREYALTGIWFLVSFLPLFLFPYVSEVYMLDSYIPLSLIAGISIGGYIDDLSLSLAKGRNQFNLRVILYSVIILASILALISNAARLRWTVSWAQEQRSNQQKRIYDIVSKVHGDTIVVKNNDEGLFYKAMLQFYDREDVKIKKNSILK